MSEYVVVYPDAVKETMLERSKKLALGRENSEQILESIRHIKDYDSVYAQFLIRMSEMLDCSVDYLLGLAYKKDRKASVTADIGSVRKVFGRRLDELVKEYKQKSGVRYVDMATYMEMDYKSLVMYREAISLPKSCTLKRIAIYFDVSVDYLLGLTDRKEI